MPLFSRREKRENVVSPDGVEYAAVDQGAVVVDVSQRAIANMSKPTT